MAHGLETLNGKVSMAFTGSRKEVWHSLGQEVSNDISTDEMLEAAGLNWKVEKRQLTLPSVNEKGEVVHKPVDNYALVRDVDDSVLSFITKDWNPCQNQEAFDFFREFVEAGDLEFSTAGSINNGQNVWALAKIKNSLNLFGEDRVDNYILFSNPHKYGKSINIRLVMERVCCKNTLAIALNENAKFSYTQNHRSEFNALLAREALGLASAKIQEFEEQAEQLASVKYTQDGMNEYLAKLFPMTVTIGEGKRKQQELSLRHRLCVDNMEIQDGAEIKHGTWWQVFNSVTNIIDHHRTNENNRDARLASTWWGSDANVKQKALKLALEMTN